MIYEFSPKGTCSVKFTFDIEDDKIKSFVALGGCHGNLQGIGKLLVGMNVDEVISRLEGIDCNHKGTSCPDQISKALKAYKAR